jgi:hypothetical protein
LPSLQSFAACRNVGRAILPWGRLFSRLDPLESGSAA